MDIKTFEELAAKTAGEFNEFAKRFRRVAEKLDEAAQILQGKPGGNGLVNSGGKSQRELLTEFLRIHGPMDRAEITQRSGFDVKVLKNWLRIEHFDRDDEGKWSVKK